MSLIINIATTNTSKQRYLAWLIESCDATPVCLHDVTNISAPPETGETFLENAKLKAAYYSNYTSEMVIASDGGVLIPSLGKNWNELLTARFAGKNTSDRDRVEALLALMKPYSGDQRLVYFHESLALAHQGTVLFTAETKSEPRLLLESYDKNNLRTGFWLTNLLYYPALQKRYTDLSWEEIIRKATHWQNLQSALKAFLSERKTREKRSK